MSESILNKAYAHARETATLAGALALLEWDQHTYMPSQAGEARANQITALSGLIHSRQTAADYGDWLRELNGQLPKLNERDAANVRGMLRDFERHVQLPEALVLAIAKATSLGQQVWVEAKQKRDFSLFRDSLDEIVRLRREEAEILLKPGRTKYDSLLDQYEEGADSNHISKVFRELRESLVPIVQQALEAERRKPSKLSVPNAFSIPGQRKLATWVADKIGFDFARGRLDETEHPFCTTLGPHDHRILTRYFEHSYSSGLYGVLHEAGHGMYEQGLPADMYGLPAGTAVSLGVHESQSRLWENAVGRSVGFWSWLYPHAVEHLPNLRGVQVPQLLADLNRVEQSLIRIESDETTYNLHIFVRFEIEQLLINEALSVDELPGIWNDRYEAYLGVRPKDDGEGVLQDVHWSAGLIGYFPTYALGNLYSVQLIESAEAALGDLNAMFAKGDFLPLLGWLRENVHNYGRQMQPHALMERVNGAPLSAKPFLRYLEKKSECR